VIQWFPGHMHKARKEMARVLPDIDVVVEVLDARIPYSSENPMLAELRGSKPCLKVLAKADLADAELTTTWMSALTSEHVHTVAVSTAESATILGLPKQLASLVENKPRRIKPFVAMVVGIPNVGKSTLINVLAGRNIAKTGNEPAITKRQQPISLENNWVLRDTPGVLWPNVSNPDSGYRLAATGAIRDTAMDSSDVAVHLLDYLRLHYGEQLQQRFGDELPLHESVETLDVIGRMRGCLSAGNLVDYDRAARVLLNELRSGQLGRITLETPSMMAHEREEVERAREEKAANREASRTQRQQKRRNRQS